MSQPQEYSVVSPAEAAIDPYPYVFVNDDGSVRELHQAERDYLETPFEPYDGARSYVKGSFESRDGWGSSKGFCARSAIRETMPIGPARAETSHRPPTKAEHIEMLNRNMVGFEITELPDGTISTRRVAQPRSRWQRILDWFRR